MNHVSIQNILGDSNNAYIMMEVFRGASNVILTDNPEFTREEFNSIFPVFKLQTGEVYNQGDIPNEVYNLFYNMILFLMTQNGDPGAQSALAGSLPRGIASSKSVDGLSISYDFMGAADDLSGYGTWKYTIYGQQLATITKIYGRGGMWVNF